MDTDWINTNTTTNAKHANKFYHRSSLGVIRNRSSCIDISQLGSSLGKLLMKKIKHIMWDYNHNQIMMNQNSID